MIKDSNERIILTLTKKQVSWLKEQSKKLDMTTSQFVKWLIDKNIGKLISRLPERELQELIKLAKVKWLDFDDRDYY